MTLQINYQPSAMLLGQMAQSAGESEYNRWLQGFNQQKAQSIANAFMGGFTQMGLPMAQMQSRENIMKQQIAARGQASAAKAMQGLEWKRNNMPLIRDWTADIMQSQYGTTWRSDDSLVQKWVNMGANMTPEDARTGVNNWMGLKRQDRSHGLQWSPSAQNARASGLMADVAETEQLNPEWVQGVTNINKKHVKPEIRQRLMESLNHQVARNKSAAGRSQTKYENFDAFVMEENNPQTGMTTRSTWNEKTRSWDHERFDPHEHNKEMLVTLMEMQQKLTASPSKDIRGQFAEGYKERANERLRQAQGLEKQISSLRSTIYPELFPPKGTDKEADSIQLDADVEAWGKRKTKGGKSNEELYKLYKNSGVIGKIMKRSGVDREEDIPDHDWVGMGMTSPPPHKAPATPSEQEASTKRKTAASLKSLQDPGGPVTSLDEEVSEVLSKHGGIVSISRGPGKFEAVDIRGKTEPEIKGLLEAGGDGLPDADTYVFENGELRQMSKPELTYSRQQESIKLEGIVQQEAAVEQQQAAQAIADQGAKKAFSMLNPVWQSGEPAPVGWVKMQSSGTRGEGGPPVREWIVPSPKLMETFKELETLNRNDMTDKYNKQIHEEKQGIKSTQGRDSLDRINALWKAYVNNIWEPPSRGLREKDENREVLLRAGSAAAIWLGYMDKDPDNVIEKFMAFARDPQGRAIPKELHEIADAYRVLAASGVFKKPGMDFGMGGSMKPGM